MGIINAIGIPIGKTIVYVPDSDGGGPSGPWTNGDTKVVMTILIITLILFLLSLIIEKIRGFSFREILSISEDGYKFLTFFSAASIITFYVIWGISTIGYLGYLIYNML